VEVFREIYLRVTSPSRTLFYWPGWRRWYAWCSKVYCGLASPPSLHVVAKTWSKRGKSSAKRASFTRFLGFRL